MTITTLRVLVALSVGRAMTIPFIGRAGAGGPGDPPDAWPMPLLGDAAVGVTGIGVLYALYRVRTPAAWTVSIAWSAIAAFDALAAFVVESQTPWPDFFMLEIFGRSMFFAAAAMHIAIIWLLTRPDALGFFDRAHV